MGRYNIKLLFCFVVILLCTVRACVCEWAITRENNFKTLKKQTCQDHFIFVFERGSYCLKGNWTLFAVRHGRRVFLIKKRKHNRLTNNVSLHVVESCYIRINVCSLYYDTITIKKRKSCWICAQTWTSLKRRYGPLLASFNTSRNLTGVVGLFRCMKIVADL